MAELFILPKRREDAYTGTDADPTSGDVLQNSLTQILMRGTSDQTFGASPKPTELFGDLPQHAAITLSEIVDSALLNYPQKAVAGFNSTQQNPIARTIQEGPAGAAVRGVAAGQEALRGAADSARTQLGPEAANPTAFSGNVPVRSLGQAGQTVLNSSNPLLGALAQQGVNQLPENVPVSAKRSDVNSFVGSGIRQGAEFAGAEAALGATAFAEAAKSYEMAKKFNIARVLMDTTGAGLVGATDTYIEALGRDGTYQPAELAKNALANAAAYGLGGAALSALSESVKLVKAQSIREGMTRYAGQAELEQKANGTFYRPVDIVPKEPEFMPKTSPDYKKGDPKSIMEDMKQGLHTQYDSLQDFLVIGHGMPEGRAKELSKVLNTKSIKFGEGISGALPDKPKEFKLKPEERISMIGVLGKDKPTRFNKPVEQLSDSELSQVMLEQRSIDAQKLATTATDRFENPPVMSPAKIAEKVVMVQKEAKKYGPLVTVDDLAQKLGKQPQDLYAMSPQELNKALAPYRGELAKQNYARRDLNRAAEASAKKTAAAAIPANQKTVLAVLKEHGVSPAEIAASLNYDISSTGSSQAVGYSYQTNRIKPTDVLRMDPNALQNMLQEGSLKDQLRLIQGASKALAKEPPEVKIKFSSKDPMENAIKYLNERRGFVPEDMSLLEANDMHASAQETAGYSDYVVKAEPDAKLSMKTVSGPVDVSGDRVYAVQYPGDNGKKLIANFSGKRLMEETQAGNIKPEKIADIGHIDDIDTFRTRVLQEGITSGVIEEGRKTIRKQLKAMGIESGKIEDALSRIDNKAMRKAILTMTLTTHAAYTEPSLNKVIDHTLDNFSYKTAMRNNIERVLNSEKDRMAFDLLYPKQSEELAGLFTKWDRLRMPTQAVKDADVAALQTKLDGKGIALMNNILKQVEDGRSIFQNEIKKGVYEFTGYSKLPPDAQASVDEWLKIHVQNNPNYVTYDRQGDYHIVEKDANGTITSREAFKTYSEAQKAAETKRAASTSGTVTFENRNTEKKIVYEPSGRRLESPLYSGTKKIDQSPFMQDINIAADRAGVAPTDQARKMLNDFLIGEHGPELSPNLQPRDYTPGAKITLESIYRNTRKLANHFAEVTADSKLRNMTPTILEQLNASMVTQNPKRRMAYADFAKEYLDTVLNSQKETLPLSMIRSALYNRELFMKVSFWLQNSLQRKSMTLPIAAGYGREGMAAYLLGTRVGDRYAAMFYENPDKIASVLAKSKLLDSEMKTQLAKLSNEGHLGALSLEDIGSISAKQKEAVDNYFNARKGNIVPSALGSMYKFAGKTAHMLNYGVATTERANRIGDAITYLGIGKKLGYTGDELYNFARRNIYNTQLGYSDMWLPTAMASMKPAPKEIAKTLTMFWRYQFESYSRHMEGIHDFFNGTGKLATGKASLKDLSAQGKNPARLPVDMAVTLGLGGLRGFNPMMWAAGLATAGSPLLATGVESMLRHQTNHPSADKILKDLQSNSETDDITNFTWDDAIEHFSRKIGTAPDSGEYNIVTSGLPSVMGFQMSRSVGPNSPAQLGPGYMHSLLNDLGEAYRNWDQGDPTAMNSILASFLFGSAASGTVEAARVLNTGRTEVKLGQERVAVKENAGMYDAILRFSRLEANDIANVKSNYERARVATQRREQLQNYVTDQVKSYLRATPGSTALDPEVQDRIDNLNIWNGIMRSKGLDSMGTLINVDHVKEVAHDYQRQLDTYGEASRTLDEIGHDARRYDKKVPTKLNLTQFNREGVPLQREE